MLAGPSGSGKSRLSERLGLPVLRLDDFYKSAGDPGLPHITHGANAGLVDWDHPDSWWREEALAAVRALCEEGRVDVPIYDLAHDGRCGHRLLDLQGSRVFVAEGIFAQEVVPQCRAAGLLAAAYCLRLHPVVTFWRRLTRDLREHRKPRWCCCVGGSRCCATSAGSSPTPWPWAASRSRPTRSYDA